MSSPSSPDAAAMPAPGALAIHLDLVGGISGDMFVAAIVDAFPALAEPVLAELAKVRPAGAAAPAFRETTNAGLRARGFGLAPASRPFAARPHDHGHDGGPQAMHDAAHASMHGGVGTSYPQLRHELVNAPLSAPTRRHALALLELLAEAEAAVHGVAADDVHFHELADWDSRLDLVAAGAIAAALEGARWTASALPLGSGTVQTAHGLLPVPAPATARLLAGYPWRDDGVPGERVTPTGAAILRHLVPAAACTARRDGGRLVGSGSGAGTRTLPGIPNLLRALVFEREDGVDADHVALLEFDIDDMTGEEIALAADRLRATPGVLDVSVGSRAGKKGRPVADYRVLARVAAADAVATACFTETSTLGLRLREERRRTLPRAEVACAVGGATLSVKVATRPGGERTAKAAHDDVAASGGLAARRRARTAAEARSLGEDDE
jgi:pyridinium-3,5-bisthiocarboxylic acid mononucleotide nickel chelatase